MTPLNWKGLLSSAHLRARLTLYTQRRIARMYWHAIAGGLPPQGSDAQDFVSDAVTWLLNREEGHAGYVANSLCKIMAAYGGCPVERALYLLLAWIIRSDLHKRAISLENRMTFRIYPTPDDGDAAPPPDGADAAPHPPPAKPGLGLPCRGAAQPPGPADGDSAEWRAVRARILEYLSDENLLCRIAQVIIDDDSGRLKIPPREIADKLGITPGEVCNAKKVLERRLEDYCLRYPDLRQYCQQHPDLKAKFQSCVRRRSRTI